MSDSILIVDDDEVFRTRLSRAFSARGLSVSEASSVDQAIEVAKEHQPYYAVIDLSMPEKSGLEFLPILKSVSPQTKSIMLTGFGSIVTTVEAMKLGAIDYLSKPADADTILSALGIKSVNSPPSSISTEVPDLKTVEWEHLQRVLHQHDGNITRAAKALGIHRRSLQRKLAKTNSPIE